MEHISESNPSAPPLPAPKPRRPRSVPGPLRLLWRPLCSRDAHVGASGTGVGLRTGSQRQELSQRVPSPAAGLRRAADTVVPGRTPHARVRRSQDLPEARRPAPHRRAQDQQLHWAGAAGAAHGQAPHHRRNRRRPARRCHGHRVRALRHGVRGLHGRRRHAPPGAERLSHAPAGRGGAQRRLRLAHAEGRHQRGHARLGHQCPHHALPAGQRSRRASLSHDGSRLSSRHQPGSAQADFAGGRPAAQRL